MPATRGDAPRVSYQSPTSIANERIALFYPGTELGGAELLIARVAHVLSDLGHDVLVIDGQCGVIADQIRDPRIRVIQSQAHSPIAVEADILIAFASHLREIGNWISCIPSTRLLFWSVHPYNAIYLPPVVGPTLAHWGCRPLRLVNQLMFPNEERASRRAIDFLIRYDGLVCMDGENVDMIARYFHHADPIPLLPVPVHLASATRTQPAIDGAPLHLFWYGRLCDFKSPGLIYLMSDLCQQATLANSVRVSVIGDGPDRGMVEQHAGTLGLQVSFHGAIPNAEAQALLAAEADIVFAMGTAALETAGLGIPTVLMPPSYGPLPRNYRYTWLHQTTRYSLGSFNTSASDNAGMTLPQVLNTVHTHALELAVQGRQYVVQHHGISEVAERLLAYAQQTRARFGPFQDAVGYQRSLSLNLGRWLARALRTLKRSLRKHES